MAQLVLGTVGAIVGSFIPGVGTALGWAIGSAIGSLIDPPKGPTVEGPKLTDLKTQTSDYGTVLPVIYGTVRMAGNVIWADEIKEKKNKNKQGKGGGGGQTTITYTYSVSFAVGLCEGIIEGIRRIWANGELIYSATENSSGGTIEESGKMAARFRVYRGTEDQIIDPTYAAVFGDDAIPYRGVAHVVFTDMQLEKFGNRMPNLEFEVVKSGVTVNYRVLKNDWQDKIMSDEEWLTQEIDPGGFMGLAMPIMPQFVSANGSFFRYSSPVKLQLGSLGNAIQTAPGKIFDFNASNTTNDIQVITNAQNAEDRPGPFQEMAKEIDGVNYDMGSICKLGVNTFLDLYVPRFMPFPQVLGHKLRDRGKLMWGGRYMNGVNPEPDYYNHGNQDLALQFPAEHQDLNFMGVHGSGDASRAIVFAGPDDYWFGPAGTPGRTRNATHWFLFEIVGGAVRCTRYGELDQTRDMNQLGGWGLPFSYWTNNLYNASGCLDTDGETYWCTYGPASVNFARYKIGDDDVMRYVGDTMASVSPDGNSSSSNFKSVWANNGVAIFFQHQWAYALNPGQPNPYDFFLVASSNPVISKSAVPLNSIIEDQLSRVGFQPTEWNTADLQEDMVDGFFLANRPSVRTAIETLTGPYFFDVVESDTVLKFVKRGKNDPVRTISFEEMGASGGAPNERPDPLTITRQQELSQPLEISAQYQDRDADYRIGVQYARRQLTHAVNQVSIQLPLVLSGTKAKQVVDTVLFNQWVEREKFEFATDLRHIDLEPTDIVNLVSAVGNVFTARLTNRSEGGDGTIKWEAVADESSVYDPLATGIYVPPTTGEQVAGSVPTFQLVFNAPPLTNQVDAPGFYVAATGYTTGWSGSIAQRSLDAGTTYLNLDNSVVDRSDASSMGYALSVLGNWTGGNTLDTTNSVLVNIIGTGELASTSYQAVLQGANGLWIGGEVIQFESAEQISPTQYRLSRLRRGRFGTERFIASHGANEQWALLGIDETQFQPDALGNAGIQQLVRGISLGTQDPSTVPSQAFVFDASTVRPLSPAHAFGIQQPGGAVEFKWVRRARLNGEWLDGIDVPLDEPIEAYQLEIATDSNFATIVRTEELGAPAYTYGPVERLADTGSTSGTIYARVVQMSSRAGRGHPANFEIIL